jgi:hypothetical protein
MKRLNIDFGIGIEVDKKNGNIQSAIDCKIAKQRISRFRRTLLDRALLQSGL